MLAGHPPFQSVNATELLLAHVNTPPRPLSEIPGLEISPEVDALILRCLAKNPDERFSDAGQLAQAIDRLRF
jgi:serine/threonine-protein kinase